MESDLPKPLVVACLCAAWCRTCDDYRPVFDEVGRRFGDRVRLRWIDIEDEAALVGDVDVDNFPTIAIVRGDQALFCGTLTPQGGTLARMIEAGLNGALGGALGASDDAEAQAFAGRLAARN